MFSVEKDDEVALYSNKSKRGHNSRSLQSVRCYECNKLGHFSRACPQKKKASKGKSTKAESLLYSSCTVKSHSSDDWFVDSGASAHMTVSKSHMENFSKPHNSEVIVADNTRLKVDCAGDVNQQLAKQSVTVKNDLYVYQICAQICCPLVK